jgi:hypothetical protein
MAPFPQLPKQLVLTAFILFLAGGLSSVIYSPSTVKSDSTDVSIVVSSIYDECGTLAERADAIVCFKKKLAPYIKQSGIEPYMQAISGRFQKSDEATEGGITRCHDILHAVGQLGAQHTKDVNKTLLSCTNLCTYGCYHGVVEGYIATGNNFEAQLPNLCLPSNQPLAPANQSACFHGVGHGIADFSGFNLEKSMNLCDRIEGAENRKDCAAGIIMELYEPSSFVHPLLQFPPDIGRFCGTLRDPYGEICYNTAGVHEYGRSEDGLTAAQTCEALPEKYQENCMTALSQNMYFAFQGSIPKTLEYCSAVAEQWHQTCIKGAVLSSVVSDPQVRRGSELCRSVAEDLRPFCYTVLKNTVVFHHGQEKIVSLCNETNYREMHPPLCNN